MVHAAREKLGKRQHCISTSPLTTTMLICIFCVYTLGALVLRLCEHNFCYRDIAFLFLNGKEEKNYGHTGFSCFWYSLSCHCCFATRPPHIFLPYLYTHFSEDSASRPQVFVRCPLALVGPDRLANPIAWRTRSLVIGQADDGGGETPHL